MKLSLNTESTLTLSQSKSRMMGKGLQYLHLDQGKLISMTKISNLSYPQQPGVDIPVAGMDFDKNSNLYVTTYGGTVLVYGKGYSLIHSKLIEGSNIISGVYVHCDGTVFLGDLVNGLIVTDKDLNVLHTITGNQFTVKDVTLTTDGTIVVTTDTSKVYLFAV